MFVERRVAAGNTFQPVVKIENDFVEWQLVSEHHASGREVFEIFLGSALVLTKLEDSADGIVVGDDHGLDDGLFNLLNIARIWKFGRAIDLDGFAADAGNAVAHARGRRNEIKPKLA